MSVPKAVVAEFEKSLDSYIADWKTDLIKHLDQYDAAQKSDDEEVEKSRLHVIHFGSTNDLSLGVRQEMPDTAAQEIFRQALNTNLSAAGSSEMGAYIKAYRTLEESGYAYDDGIKKWGAKVVQKDAPGLNDVHVNQPIGALPIPGTSKKKPLVEEEENTNVEYIKPITKEEEELIEKVIRQEGSKYHVYSEDGQKHLGGPYDSKAKAVERLRQIEYFKTHKDAGVQKFLPPQEVYAAAKSAYDQGTFVLDITSPLVEGFGLTRTEIERIVEHFADTSTATEPVLSRDAWGGRYAAKWANRVIKKIEKDEQEAVAKAGNGIMLAFWLDPEIANKFAVEGGEKPEDLHLTLAYFGKLDAVGVDALPTLEDAVEMFAATHGPIPALLDGLGRFPASPSSDDKDVIYLGVHSTEIQQFRQELVDGIEALGIEPYKNFGYNPHITLKYVGLNAPHMLSTPNAVDVVFDRIILTIGSAHKEYPLMGVEKGGPGSGPQGGRHEKDVTVSGKYTLSHTQQGDKHFIGAYHKDAETGIGAFEKLKTPKDMGVHNLVGFLGLEPHPSGGLQAINTHVDRAWRRQGAATAMYNYAGKVTGQKIVPSDTLSANARDFWSARARTNKADSDYFWEEVFEKYSPDQPRDDHGRWGEGGGGTATATAKVKDTFAHIKVESAKGSDIAAIQKEVVGKYKDRAASAQEMISMMTTADHLSSSSGNIPVQNAIARDDKGTFLGAVQGHAFDNGRFEVDLLAVNPKILSGQIAAKGVGTRLMVEAAKMAGGHGLTLISLDQESNKFYQALGMKNFGTSRFDWSSEQTAAVAAHGIHKADDSFDVNAALEAGLAAEEEHGAPLAGDKSKVAKSDSDFEFQGTIIKLDKARHMVFGWFSIVQIGGKDVEDTQGDIITSDTLENSSYLFVLTARIAGAMHETDQADEVVGIGKLVESVVFTKEKQTAMVDSLKKQGIDAQLDLGCVAWWGGMYITDEKVWQRVVAGELNAWSIGGKGKRDKIEKQGEE